MGEEPPPQRRADPCGRSEKEGAWGGAVLACSTAQRAATRWRSPASPWNGLPQYPLCAQAVAESGLQEVMSPGARSRVISQPRQSLRHRAKCLTQGHAANFTLASEPGPLLLTTAPDLTTARDCDFPTGELEPNKGMHLKVTPRWAPVGKKHLKS